MLCQHWWVPGGLTRRTLQVREPRKAEVEPGRHKGRVVPAFWEGEGERNRCGGPAKE